MNGHTKTPRPSAVTLTSFSPSVAPPAPLSSSQSPTTSSRHLVADSAKPSSIKGCVAVVPATMHWNHILPKYKSMYRSYDDNVGAPIINKGAMEAFYAA